MYFGNWFVLTARIYVLLSNGPTQALDPPWTINQAQPMDIFMNLQSFAFVMNTLMNIAILPLFLQYFWGAWYTQSSGEGAVGDKGDNGAWENRMLGSQVKKAAPPWPLGRAQVNNATKEL